MTSDFVTVSFLVLLAIGAAPFGYGLVRFFATIGTMV